jgi:anti-sigma factor RsiW
MNCDNWREDLSASIDGELPAGQRSALAAHLRGCPECRRLLRDFEETTALLRAEPVPAAPVRVTDAALALVRAQAAQRNRTRPGARLRRVLFEPLWPKLSVEFAGLALAGLVAFVVVGESSRSHLDRQAAEQAETAARSAATAAAAATVIAGNLVVLDSGTGLDRLTGLVRSLHGEVRTSGSPGNLTVHALVPASEREALLARLPELGRWHSAEIAAPGAPHTVIEIRIIEGY